MTWPCQVEERSTFLEPGATEPAARRMLAAGMRDGRREYKRDEGNGVFRGGIRPNTAQGGGKVNRQKYPAARGRMESGHRIGRFHTESGSCLWLGSMGAVKSP
jgi:hypothetical protein